MFMKTTQSEHHRVMSQDELEKLRTSHVEAFQQKVARAREQAQTERPEVPQK